MRLRFTPFLSSLLPLPGLLLYSNLLLLAPGVSSRLARPWRLVLSRLSLLALASRLALLAPGVSPCLARPRCLFLSCLVSPPASCLVLLCPLLLAPGVSFHLARSRCLVLSRSPPASCPVSLAPGVSSCLARSQSGLARPRRLVWSGLARPRRLVKKDPLHTPENLDGPSRRGRWQGRTVDGIVHDVLEPSRRST